MQRKKKIIVAASITTALLLVVSVVFAALASQLNISFGNVTQNALTWNVGFKGDSSTPTFDGTSTTGSSCGTATVTPSTVTISDTTLSKPGDKCTYPLIIENKGDIAANLSAIAATKPTSTECTITNNSTMECGNITYQLQTTSGSALTTGITLNKKEEYNIKLVISYTGETLNSTSVTQTNAKFTITYTQAQNRTAEAPSGVSKVKAKVCKRATALHTETCNMTSAGCYSDGYYEGGTQNTQTIIYGTLGTSGTLTAGDAFDCDVNGDGIYDAETERFYYISGINGEASSDYAVLIYYANVKNGEVNKNATIPYYTDEINYLGPITAYEQLPTTSQWPNISLVNSGKRQIYSSDGTTEVSGEQLPIFEYKNRAARLLSYNELDSFCENTNSLTAYSFLMENAAYNGNSYSISGNGYWLETPISYIPNFIYLIDGLNRFVGGNPTNSTSYGVRPVIEVPLSDIDY